MQQMCKALSMPTCDCGQDTAENKTTDPPTRVRLTTISNVKVKLHAFTQMDASVCINMNS